MSTLTVATVKSNSSSPPVFQNTSGTEIGRLCRAFVNFNGTGTVAINGQYNVSSITDNGTGDYTINFTTALADANYCPVAQVSPIYGVEIGATNLFDSGSGETAGTTTAFRFTTRRGVAQVLTDIKFVCVSIFR